MIHRRILSYATVIFLAWIGLVSVFAESSTKEPASPLPPHAKDLLESKDRLLKGPFFWETKAEVREKMLEEKRIPVSVTRDEDLWIMKGAGVVEAPAEFVLREAQNFSHLREAPEHFEEVTFPEDRTSLRLKVKSRWVQEAVQFEIEHGSSEIRWRVSEGDFKGSRGFLRVLSIDKGKSEVALVGIYPGQVAWYLRPGFAWGTEVVLQHVAQQMRSRFEREYRKNRP